MKRIKSILIIGLFAYILSGCTYWTMNSSEPSHVASSNETIQKKEYVYTDDLSAYKKVKLELNIDVSDVTIKKASDQTFTLTQHADQKKIFLIPTSTSDGDTLYLSFDSPEQHSMSLNSFKSDIVIELPENILYTLNSSVDVGKFELNLDSIQFENLSIITDVGSIDVVLDSDQSELKNIGLSGGVGKVNLKLNKDASSLESILLSSDVGDLTLSTSGRYPSLQQINLNDDTGKITLDMDGTYTNAFTLNADSDIGQISINLSGDYAENTNVKCSTSTGGLKLKIDKQLKVKLLAEEEEFVSKIKFNNVAHTAHEDYFFINNATSDQFDMTIEADSDIGNIEINN